MVSPYLLKPLRSIEDVLSGARAPALPEHPVADRRATYATGKPRSGDDRTVARPRLVWTNAAFHARFSRRPRGRGGPKD